MGAADGTGTIGPGVRAAGTSGADPGPTAGSTGPPGAAPVARTERVSADPDRKETPAGPSDGPTPDAALVAKGTRRVPAGLMPALPAGPRAMAVDRLGKADARPGLGPVLAPRPARLRSD